MSTNNPDCTLFAHIAVQTGWADNSHRIARTAPARAAVNQKFLDPADGYPDRAARLRRAHFQRLAGRSAQARRSRREQTGTDR